MVIRAIRVVFPFSIVRSTSGLHRWLWVLLVMGLGGWLRGQAAQALPVEADEPLYLRVAYLYSRALCSNDLLAILRIHENLEHPPLVKLLYSAAWPCAERNPDLLIAIQRARWIAVIFGTLAAGALAILHPAGGILFSVHPTAVYYTSVAMLESVPVFLVALAALAACRSSRSGDRWFWGFFIALGLTAASKYIYAPISIAFGFRHFKRWGVHGWLVGLATAMALFGVLNFPVWTALGSSGLESFAYHLRYAQSSHVAQANLPWYQPVRWLTASAAELGILLAGILGWMDEIRRRLSVAGFSLGVAIAFLLIWPTKWPHYTLIAVLPLCLTAASVLWKTRLSRLLAFFLFGLSIVANYDRIRCEKHYPLLYAVPHSSPSPVPLGVLDGIELESVRIHRQDRKIWVFICWTPQRAFPTGYSLFLHLLGESPPPGTESPLWDQWDGPALNGAYDSSFWIPKVRFCEMHLLELPDFAPDGRYMLATGWYQWETGKRIPVRYGPVDPRFPDAIIIDRWEVP
ncbi:hypothetical protein [Thermoflexus sp.]|uniref:hypothetical protein n=1 Tax=Thermoflexus sp. TaxID=1969742 RepID=UPI002ADDA774|nr:hypothetical protein [Thermoflexus sp.]